jgi:transcriptional regulator with XRE-family HTH domain
MEKISPKELRLRRGLTQEEVAVAVGVTVQAVSSWETGKYNISDLSRYKLAAFYNINPDEIQIGR